MPRIPGPQDVGQTRAAVDRGPRNIGAVNQAVGDVGKTIFQVADRLRQQRQKAEDVGFRAQYNVQLQRESQRIWEETKQTAVEGSESFPEAFDARMKERGEELMTEIRRNGARPSREALSQAQLDLARTRGNYGVKAVTYENNVRVAKIFEDAEESFRGLSVQAYNNPDTLDEQLTSAKEIISGIAGVDPEKASQIRQPTIEEIAVSSAEGLIAQQPQMALSRLKEGEYDQYVDAGTKDQLIRRAETAAEEDFLRGESQQITDSLVQRHTSLTDALSDARTIEDPELRDRTVKRLKVRFNEIQAQQSAQEEQLSEQAWGVVQEGGDVDDIPRNVWLNLPAKERIKLQEHVEKKAGGKGIETNWGTYYELTEMANDPDQQEKFAKTNLYREHRNDLSNTEFKKLVKMQQDVRNKLRGNDFDETDLTDVRNTNQIVDDTLRDMGVDPSPKEGEKQATQAREFRRLVQDEITQLERQEQRKATAQEKQEIVDNLSMRFQDEGFFGFFRDEEANVVDEVPAKFLDPIASALREAGVPVTGENIYQMYQDMKERGEIQ